MPSSELVACKPTDEELPDFAGRLDLKVPWVAPDAAQRHDLAAMRAAVTERTRLVYVCNPNNPNGTAVTRDAILGDRTRVHARRSRPVPGGFARCARRLSR